MAISFNATSLLNGNGINVQSIVNTLLDQQSGPLTVWRNEQTDLSTQAGLLAGINNNLTNLQSTVVALANPTGPLASQAATSSDTSILTANAESGAAAGTHQIVVSKLATTGTIYTDPLKDGNTSFLANAATTGDIKLQVGGSAGETHDIVITQGSNDTISTLASYINSQNWGVSANVVTDANGARLALFSQATGMPGALSISSNDTSLAFAAPVGGTNASLTVDGVPVSSATNRVNGVIDGVTLNLAAADAGTTVQVTVGPDTAQATTAINTFVNAYNALVNSFNTQFSVDPTTNTQGPLAGDGGLRSLQSSLLRDATYALTGNSGLINLAMLGIDMNNDGTLTVNQTATDTHPALADVLAKSPGAVQTFFQNAAGTGFAQNFNNDLVNLTDVTDGVMNVDIAGNKAQQRELTNRITDLQDRLAAQQKVLTAQYAQVNATLEAYPSLLSTITAVLGAMNGNFNVTPTINANTSPAAGTVTQSGSSSTGA